MLDRWTSEYLARHLQFFVPPAALRLGLEGSAHGTPGSGPSEQRPARVNVRPRHNTECPEGRILFLRLWADRLGGLRIFYIGRRIRAAGNTNAMSGIAGHIRFDGGPVGLGHIETMTRKMAHRGPDGINHWVNGPVGLGHCLLRTTEEAEHEQQPVANEDQSAVLVFDGWLQNWIELRSELLSRGVRLRNRSDSELVLRAYETWGHRCVDHLHGDFALGIWDGRRQEAFCARDRIGMRPFHYAFAPTFGFRFASDPEAVVDPALMPCRLDEGRIADAIVGGLEGLDQTSTFYLDVHRLPPAHLLIISRAGLRTEKYWTFDPPRVLHLSSDEAYAEAFREVFSDAVKCRLRGGATTVAMLSGGLDSGSVVATARTLRARAGGPPLRTFSAVGPDPNACVETRSIHAAAGMDGLTRQLVDYSDLAEFMPELANLTLDLSNPFDCNMTLVRAVYLAAHRAGAKAILDGVGGDLVLSGSGFLPYLLRRGRWTKAWHEARARRTFYGGGKSDIATLLEAARSAFAPNWLRRLRRQSSQSRGGMGRPWSGSLIDPDFADRTGLAERYTAFASNRPVNVYPGAPMQRAAGIFHFHIAAARERYEREAARLGLEPRDPFFDLRMIMFCVSLPVEQMVRDGWTKFVMRSALAGQLPDAVRWRRGKEHLGWAFTQAIMRSQRDHLLQTVAECRARLVPYIDVEAFDDLIGRYLTEFVS